MELSDIRPGAVYETVHQQLRRVLRLTTTSVYYETIGDARPFYTSCVRTDRFAADAIREHKITPVLTSRRRLNCQKEGRQRAAPSWRPG